MSVYEKIDDVRARLKEIQRDSRFRKAARGRDQSAELQMALGQCRGRLKGCSADLEHIMAKQSRAIQDGTRLGKDTHIQEDILWDAAMGYLLVDDAMYALESISSEQSIAYAYELLESATKKLAKEGSAIRMPSLKFGKKKERNIYGYKTVEVNLEEKNEIVKSIWELLVETGDIEYCLEEMRSGKLSKKEARKPETEEMDAEDDEMEELKRRRSRAGAVKDEDGMPDARIKKKMSSMHNEKDEE